MSGWVGGWMYGREGGEGAEASLRIAYSNKKGYKTQVFFDLSSNHFVCRSGSKNGLGKPSGHDRHRG